MKFVKKSYQHYYACFVQQQDVSTRLGVKFGGFYFQLHACLPHKNQHDVIFVWLAECSVCDGEGKSHGIKLKRSLVNSLNY